MVNNLVSALEADLILGFRLLFLFKDLARLNTSTVTYFMADASWVFWASGASNYWVVYMLSLPNTFGEFWNLASCLRICFVHELVVIQELGILLNFNDFLSDFEHIINQQLLMILCKLAQCLYFLSLSKDFLGQCCFYRLLVLITNVLSELGLHAHALVVVFVEFIW